MKVSAVVLHALYPFVQPLRHCQRRAGLERIIHILDHRDKLRTQEAPISLPSWPTLLQVAMPLHRAAGQTCVTSITISGHEISTLPIFEPCLRVIRTAGHLNEVRQERD